MAKAPEKKDGKEGDGVITAVYKLNLHCPQCAREIRKPLMRTEGIRKVDVDVEKSEIKVHGKIDVIKIHERIKKISRKKVELVSPIPKSKDISASEKKEREKKETKEPVLHTTTLKVHMHCSKCEQDLKKKILKLKGIHSVKTDMKAQTLVAEGTMEPPKLVEYIRKKVHKHAEIVTQKREEEKKEKAKEVDAKTVEKKKSTEEVEEKKVEEKKVEEKKVEEKKVEEKKVEEKKVEVKSKETNVPYIVHYVYAPQLFSDENPNACSIQ